MENSPEFKKLNYKMMLQSHAWVCNFPRLFSVALITLNQEQQGGEGFLYLTYISR